MLENLPTVTYRPERPDFVRGPATLILIGSLVVLLGFAGYESAESGSNSNQVKEHLNIALPALTALLGSAMGFYFGTSVRTSGATRSTTSGNSGATGSTSSGTSP